MNEMEEMKTACTQEGCDKRMDCFGGGPNKTDLCMSGMRQFLKFKEKKKEMKEDMQKKNKRKLRKTHIHKGRYAKIQ